MRIRYNNMVDVVTGEENGLLRSARNYPHPSNGAQYFVVLNPSVFGFRIYDAVAGMDAGIVQEGTGTSEHKMKILAKNTLIRLGVDTGKKESRNITKKLNPLDANDPVNA